MAGGRGVNATKLPSIAGCTLDWFLFPWIYVHLHNFGHLLTDAPIENVSVAVSGWINPVFLLLLLSLLIGKTPRLSRISRYVFLLMLPFCWIVFLKQDMYPLQGYFLWTGGMLLVLFSSALESRRPAVTTSGQAAHP